jgi:hypothetical protein
MLPVGAPDEATRTGRDRTCVITPKSSRCSIAATTSVDPLWRGSTGAVALANAKSLTP